MLPAINTVPPVAGVTRHLAGRRLQRPQVRPAFAIKLYDLAWQQAPKADRGTKYDNMPLLRRELQASGLLFVQKTRHMRQ